MNCTSPTEARIVWVRSEMIETLMAGGIDASSCGSSALMLIDRRDHVGAGLALNGQNDRALLVVPAGEQVVLRSLDRLADVADADRRAVAIGDDQVRHRRPA